MTSRRPLPGELEPIERASLDELRALQLERMRWSVRHAYENVPHYRRAFDAKGVRPEDLKELADLARFPFTVKGDLRDHYPFGMLAVPRERIALTQAAPDVRRAYARSLIEALRDRADADLKRIEAFYADRGYPDARDA